MELENSYGKPIDLTDGGALFEDAFLSVWRGDVDNDGYNGLAQTAGLWSGEVTILRAYGRYLQQAGIPQSQDFIAAALNRYPDIARGLHALFVARLGPTAETEGVVAAKHLKAKIKDALEDVPNIDDDTIIRRYLNLIEASLRTNHFVAETKAEGPVAGDQARIRKRSTACRRRGRGARSSSTAPRSRACICASARWRAAACAGRTAPRTTAPRCSAWSRRSRSRTPSSCRSAPRAASSRSACRPAAAATRSSRPAPRPTRTSSPACCRSPTISGCDGVIPPAGVVRRDPDDPYFVVAADKGTATFSDTANAITEKHGFWLDDAFASGGSAGYDHKKMGITAKGAWEAVKRHFREINRDIQTSPFTVVGVGDMSGDVFGNGMLLSPQTRLIAAFDHRDIFIDPDPDMAASMAERERMFALPRSSWQDYDKTKLSEGGVIVSRSQKSITLPAAAAAAIGLDQDDRLRRSRS